MIYFTEVTQADGRGAEKVIFQFYPRELPEVIPFGFKTKVNHIEYPGGFVTNQIIGVYQDTIEWEGTFYGVYKDEKGRIITAKERAFKIKELLGRPIRCVFAVPNAEVKSIPGYGEQSNVGALDSGENSASIKNGVSYVYIIEEYTMSVSNYTDVNYKIKLTPHQRQEKIKPKDVTVAQVKVNMQEASNAGKRIARNNKPIAKPPVQNAATQGKSSEQVANNAQKSAELGKGVPGYKARQEAAKRLNSKP